MKKQDFTTIQLKRDIVSKLKQIKRYPRETYEETIERLIENETKNAAKDQYDKFLNEAQKQKMKDLWDNEEDEAWNEV
jgi:tartrate dehydratase alpha subunit/fumarate hydratase class I-like protein